MNFYQMWQVINEGIFSTNNQHTGISYQRTTKNNYMAHLASIHDMFHDDPRKVSRFDIAIYFKRMHIILRQYNNKLNKLSNDIMHIAYPRVNGEYLSHDTPQLRSVQEARDIYEQLCAMTETITNNLKYVTNALKSTSFNNEQISQIDVSFGEILHNIEIFQIWIGHHIDKITIFKNGLATMKKVSEFINFIAPQIQNMEIFIKKYITARPPNFSPPGAGGIDHPEPTLAPPDNS